MGKDHPKLLIGSYVGRFKVTKHIGAGGFGEIYSVFDPASSKMCAMKIETLSQRRSSLKLEIEILKEMKNSKDAKYFPDLIDYGKTHSIRYYVMELLGASLQNMRHVSSHKKFSIYTTLKIALESLKAIEALHKQGWVHRDIKPGNFLIRDDKDYPICLIDFGLCRRYIDKKTGKIIPPREDPGFTGTCRYASVNAHNYKELSRRDDIISWIYTFVELCDGRLPWPGTKDREKTKEMKKTITANQLMQSFSDDILEIYRDARKLRFEDEPNYKMYRDLIKRAMEEENPKRKGFDWEYYKKDIIQEVMPNLAVGQPKQASKASLSSTKAIVGPPRKPFVLPDHIPPLYQTSFIANIQPDQNKPAQPVKAYQPPNFAIPMASSNPPPSTPVKTTADAKQTAPNTPTQMSAPETPAKSAKKFDTSDEEEDDDDNHKEDVGCQCRI